MRPWVVKLFIQILPKVLFIERPKKGDSIDDDDDEKHGEILSGVFDVPSEIDKYLGYNHGYCTFDYDVPPPLPASRYCGARAICAAGVPSGGVSSGTSAVAGSNDTVVNMASDEDEDAIELDAEDEYDDMFSPTTTTDDGLASPIFENLHHNHRQHHHHGCPVDQRARHDPAMQTIQDAKFIAQHVKNQDKFDEASVNFVKRVFYYPASLICKIYYYSAIYISAIWGKYLDLGGLLSTFFEYLVLVLAHVQFSFFLLKLHPSNRYLDVLLSL